MRNKIVSSVLLFLCYAGSANACIGNSSDVLLCETPEILFETDEAIVIQEKAQELGSAVNIYEYLRNNASYAVYHGARSSSLNAFLGMEGNDVDLASTLIAMFRSVGVKSRYAMGNVRVKRSEIANWIKVGNEELAVSILQDQGINVSDDPAPSSDPNYVLVEHVWVEALVNFSNYRGASESILPCVTEDDECKWVSLDPSFKLRSYEDAYRNALSSVDFDYDAYYNAESSQLNRDKSPLEIFEEQSLSFMRGSYPGITLEDVIDNGEIIEEVLGLFPSSLPYNVIGAVENFESVEFHDANSSTETWNKKIAVKIYPIIGGLECSSFSMGGTFSAVELSTKQLTVNWGIVEGQTRLATRLDGVPRGFQLTGNFTINCNGRSELITDASRFNIVLEVDASPYQDPIEVRYNNLMVGGYYLVATGGETSNWSQVRRAYKNLLDANNTYPLITDANDDVFVDENNDGVVDGGDTPLLEHQQAQDALTGGLLYTAQALYYTRLKEESRRYSRLKNIVSPIAAFAGIVSTTFEVELVDETPFAVLPGGLLIDLKGLRINGSWEADSAETYSNETFKFLGHVASSLEHEIWQELTGYDAVSTMRGIQFALGAGSKLLDIHNNYQGNTFLPGLSDLGFNSEIPAQYAQHSHNFFGNSIVSWENEGGATDDILEMMRADVSGYQPEDIESRLINYFGNNSVHNSLKFYDDTENILINLATTENDLNSFQRNIAGVAGGSLVAVKIASPATGFSVTAAPTGNADVWVFNVTETDPHHQGGEFDVEIDYTLDNGLDTVNFNVSGFTDASNLGYSVVSASVASPSGFTVSSFTQISSDVWRFVVAETTAHSGIQNLTLSYRLDNGLDSWTSQINAPSSIIVTSANVTSPSGFTIDSFNQNSAGWVFNFRETQAHSSATQTINYSLITDTRQIFNRDSGITGIISASLTQPSSGFRLVSSQAYGGGWRFVIEETQENTAGTYNFTLAVSTGSVSGNLTGSLTVVGPQPSSYQLQQTLFVDNSVTLNGRDYSNPTGTTTMSLTLGADTQQLTCSGNQYTALPSVLLSNLQNCYDGWVTASNLGELLDLLDQNQGFDVNDYVFRNNPIGLTEHSMNSIGDIRSNMYFGGTEYWRNFTMPADLTSGPFYLFEVYIKDTYDASNENLVSSAYIIKNESMRLLAGGGYVPEGVPVVPSTDTEGVVGSGESIDTSGATFNNEVFTDQNLVAIANNDIIRTPSTVDPVSTVTGNMYHDETDVMIAGKGLPYGFTRTYNSNETSSDGVGSANPTFLPLSQGWTHSYNMKLVSNDYGQYPNYGTDLAPENENNLTSSITYVDERGGESNYLLDDANTSNQPSSPRAGFDDMQINASGLHTITYANGVVYTFDSRSSGITNMRTPGATARLYRIEDAYGNQLNFGYNGLNQLTAITDNVGLSGRSGLTLSYYTSGANNGRLRYVADWTGRQWAYNYSNGQLSGVVNPLGDAMAYTYVAGTHWLKDIIHPQDRNGKQKTMTFSYYENGQAYNYVDQMGSEESLIYDLYRKRTRITNPRGLIAEHYYDQNGALKKLVEPNKGILLFDNNEDGLRYQKYDAMGNRTQYSYHTDRTLTGKASDTLGQVTRAQDALGYTVDTDYGVNGQVAVVKGKNGNRSRNVYYQTTNAAIGAIIGKLEKTVVDQATVNGVLHTNVTLVDYEYNSDGAVRQKTEFIDPAVPSRVRITTYTYGYNDGDGSYTLNTRVSGSGKSVVVDQVFDALWRLSSTTTYRRTSATDPSLIPLTISYEYDGLGRKVKTIDPIGNIDEVVYDQNGQVSQSITRYKLQLQNNSPIKAQCVIDPLYPTHHTCINIVNEYDAADRLVRTTNILGAVTRFEYNAMGHWTKVTNDLGNSLRYEYDAMGRRTKVTDEKGYTITTKYDLAGRVLKVTDANKNSISYTYDALGRQLTVTSPQNRVTRFDQYDGKGNIIRMTDPNGVAGTQSLNSQNASVYNVFDEFGRIVSSLNAQNEQTGYRFDLSGNRTAVIDAKNQVTNFIYDDLGLLVGVVDPIIESGTDRVVSITYDELGNRLTYTDRLGEVTRYSYDRLNRPLLEDYLSDGILAEKIYDQYGDMVSTNYGGNTYLYSFDVAHRLLSKTDTRSNLSMAWQYDSVGNVIRKTNFEGDVHRFTYDSSNRVVAMAVGEPLLVIQASYHYDPAGRLLSRILSNGAATLYNYTADGFLTSLKQVGADGYQLDLREYEYDEIGNIKRMTINKTEVVDYIYDGAYRLLNANSSVNAHDYSYTYDAVGNRLSKTVNGSTQHFIYGNGNRLNAVRQTTTSGPLVYSFTYDANGSMTGKSNGSGQPLLNIDYDQRRLASIMSVNSQPGSLAFEYDANQYRIEKQNNTGTKKYYLEGEHLESVYDVNDELQANYLRGVVVDEIINGFERNTVTEAMENRTFHHDQVNSVVALSDHNGDAVQSLSYGPFGESLGVTGTSQNTMQYTGREQDAESGLYYYRARYYDSELGRFISEDPVGFKGGINFYAYVGNNPLIYNDPTGNCPHCLAGIGIGILWGLGTRAVTDLVTGNLSSGQEYFGAAVGGGVSGGLAALTGGASLLVGTGARLAIAGGTSALGSVSGVIATEAANASTLENYTFEGAEFGSDIVIAGTLGFVFGVGAKAVDGVIPSTASLGYALTRYQGGSTRGLTPTYRTAAQAPAARFATLGQGVVGNMTSSAIDSLYVFDEGGTLQPIYSNDTAGYLDSTYGFTNEELINAGNDAGVNFRYDGSGSAGGFVLYPNKVNSNASVNVYSK